MRAYRCKKEVNGTLVNKAMQDIFGNSKEKNGKFEASFPPLVRISVVLTGKKEISVETESRGEDNSAEAIKAYNKFLFEVTGYTAKERKKMAMK